MQNLIRALLIGISVGIIPISMQASAASQSSSSLNSPIPKESRSEGKSKLNIDGADAEERGMWRFNWNARVYGLGVSDEIEESRVSGLKLSADLVGKINAYVDLKGGVRANFSTGSTHSLYEMNRVENGITLDEALLNLSPVPEHLILGLGAVNQRFLQNPLLVDELSFPGAREQFLFGGDILSMGLAAQQAIPSSSSLSTRTSEKEPLPSFYTETAFIKLNASKMLTFQARGGHYAFYDLPSEVAFESYSQGNLVDAEVAQNASFDYDFAGWMYGGDITVNFTKGLNATFGADGITNTEAPSKYASGLLSFAQTEIGVTRNWTLIPRFEYFRNERHSSPAFYNSPDYGHNNRHGFSYDLRAQSLKDGLAFKAKYTDGRLIESDPTQANSQIFMLYMEVSNAKF